MYAAPEFPFDEQTGKMPITHSHTGPISTIAPMYAGPED